MEGHVFVEGGTALGRSAMGGGEGEGRGGGASGEDGVELVTALTTLLLLLLLLPLLLLVERCVQQLLLLLACRASVPRCGSLAGARSLTARRGGLPRSLPCHCATRPSPAPERGGEGGG